MKRYLYVIAAILVGVALVEAVSSFSHAPQEVRVATTEKEPLT